MPPDALIRDYLRTQGLKLPVQDVQVALLAAQTVMASGQAAIEAQLLWPKQDGFALADFLPPDAETAARLKQVFMALDSFVEQQPVRSAAVYLRQECRLLRLCAQGGAVEAVLPAEPPQDTAAVAHLAQRSAQTGWLNQVDDVAQWLAAGDLCGSRHRPGSQLAVPVAGINGRVFGILYLEDGRTAAFDAAALSHWIGLALALTEPLAALCGGAEAAAETE